MTDTLHDTFSLGLQRLANGQSYAVTNHQLDVGPEAWRPDSENERCDSCEGNGVLPEAFDQHGDPAAKYLPGVPYAVTFYETCQDCAGTGKRSAPLPHQGDSSGRTGQRGGHFSGGDA